VCKNQGGYSRRRSERSVFLPLALMGLVIVPISMEIADKLKEYSMNLFQFIFSCRQNGSPICGKSGEWVESGAARRHLL